jgi:hypothetical protein
MDWIGAVYWIKLSGIVQADLSPRIFPKKLLWKNHMSRLIERMFDWSSGFYHGFQMAVTGESDVEIDKDKVLVSGETLIKLDCY